VIVDATDKPWIITASALAVVGALSYIVYAASATSGPSGGTWPGLAYGVVGTGMMAFAGLLGARKKVSTLRIGRVQAWMRGHVWLGLLSFPMILFHAGFSMGGSLTYALMILFGIIVFSGIVGVILQQFIPRLMMEQVPVEVIYEQAEEVLRQLLEKAEKSVETLKPKPDAEDLLEYGIVKEFYLKEVKPFLLYPKQPGLLTRTARARLIFDHVGKLVPPASHHVVEELQKIVQQRRDLAAQVRLHHILHSWLLVHVPLSAAVLVLALLHAVMALRYN
jgi:hypothetical protein